MNKQEGKRKGQRQAKSKKSYASCLFFFFFLSLGTKAQKTHINITETGFQKCREGIYNSLFFWILWRLRSKGIYKARQERVTRHCFLLDNCVKNKAKTSLNWGLKLFFDKGASTGRASVPVLVGLVECRHFHRSL